MNQPAFILEFSPNELPAVTAARSLAEDLAANVPITRKHLSQTFTRLTGATDADNRWSLSDTHASVELAQLLYLQAASKITPAKWQKPSIASTESKALPQSSITGPKNRSASSNSRHRCDLPGSQLARQVCRTAISPSNRRPELACSPFGRSKAGPN